MSLCITVIDEGGTVRKECIVRAVEGDLVDGQGNRYRVCSECTEQHDETIFHGHHDGSSATSQRTEEA